MVTKFKVGDRVICIKNPETGNFSRKIGTICTVKNLYSVAFSGEFEFYTGLRTTTLTLIMLYDDFELVPTSDPDKEKENLSILEKISS